MQRQLRQLSPELDERAEEALEDIRRGRRMITGLTQFKKLNICGAGNKPNTRMHTLYN